MIFSSKRRYFGTPHQTIQASQILFTKRMDFKAELLQLNRTQFPSLGIFVSKKVGNRKIKTTFNISVLKVVFYVSLVFFEIQFFY